LVFRPCVYLPGWLVGVDKTVWRESICFQGKSCLEIFFGFSCVEIIVPNWFLYIFWFEGTTWVWVCCVICFFSVLVLRKSCLLLYLW
jgi:hypothetical protein